MKVKIGIHLMVWTANLQENLTSYFEEAKVAGFDGVEIPIIDPMKLDFKIVKSLREALEKFDLECTCGGGLGREPSLIHENINARKRGKEYLKRYVDICSDLSSNFLAGVLYGGFEVSLGRGRNKDEWSWAIEGIREVAEYAEARQVTLCLEAINRYETYFLNTAEDGVQLVKEIDKDNVKLHLDTYHMNIEEKDFYNPIVKSKRYLGYLHCSENDRGVPGTGHVNWDSIFRALSKTNYQGWLVIEGFLHPIKEIPIASSIWRPVAKSAEEVVVKGCRFIKAKVDEHNL
ncbi:sugar phosphate isomerase/epimerase [Candidatus Aerophobetes bacterium]|uniref:Sugar phosphate isomerase/epimerase n=1 Tax=Aerophobetes bacterium TaxID=2030807 RepID=A0A523S316_UNCAE|nr:MAG: sugar phosphate isomerase/epimerase [Candidatus Aerophobetes bacterium]